MILNVQQRNKNSIFINLAHLSWNIGINIYHVVRAKIIGVVKDSKVFNEFKFMIDKNGIKSWQPIEYRIFCKKCRFNGHRFRKFPMS